MFLFDPRTGTYGFGGGLEGDDERSLLDVLDDDIAAQDQDKVVPMEQNEDSTVNNSDKWESGISITGVVISEIYLLLPLQ